MSLLSLRKLSFRYPGGPPVLADVSAEVESPSVIAVIGPNGAGKSTLLDLVAGQKLPESGACEVEGKATHSMPRAALCRMVAHIPQQVPADVPYTVEEVILTGRIPYGRGLYENAEDYEAMERAIARTRLEAFRHRRFASLSGGEKQRVLVAAALCQQARILLLDEPGAHLDPENQAQLWELLAELRTAGHVILTVTHHLALAAQNSDRIWLLSRGRIVADAAPDQALRPERLEEIFHVPFHWHRSEQGRVFLTYGQ